MREVVGIYPIKAVRFRLFNATLGPGPGCIVTTYTYRGGTLLEHILRQLYMTTRPIIDKSETSRYACTTAAVKGSTQHD